MFVFVIVVRYVLLYLRGIMFVIVILIVLLMFYLCGVVVVIVIMLFVYVRFVLMIGSVMMFCKLVVDSNCCVFLGVRVVLFCEMSVLCCCSWFGIGVVVIDVLIVIMGVVVMMDILFYFLIGDYCVMIYGIFMWCKWVYLWNDVGCF